MLKLERFLPAPLLAKDIDTYYYIEGHASPEAPMQDIVLPELANIRIQIQGQWRVRIGGGAPFLPATASIFGFTTHATHVGITENFRCFGVGILPHGWQRLFGLGAHELTDKCIPLDALLGGRADMLVDRLLYCQDGLEMARCFDQFFWALANERDRQIHDSMLVLDAALAQYGHMSVGEFAAQTAFSTRQVQRLCQNYYGCNPKLLVRKIRFLHNFSSFSRDDQARGADMIGEEYYDQSHFIREFKRFTDSTPMDFMRKKHDIIQSVLASYDISHKSNADSRDLIQIR